MILYIGLKYLIIIYLFDFNNSRNEKYFSFTSQMSLEAGSLHSSQDKTGSRLVTSVDSLGGRPKGLSDSQIWKDLCFMFALLPKGDSTSFHF